MKNKIVRSLAVIVMFSFVFFLLPNLELYAQNENLDETLINTSIPVADIQTKIVNNTPNWIAKPLISFTNFLENFRISNKEKAQIKKETIKNQILELKTKVVVENTDSNTIEESGNQDIDKNSSFSFKLVLKYLQLFFLFLISFILSSQILFYVLSLLILLSIIKILWQKLF